MVSKSRTQIKGFLYQNNSITILVGILIIRRSRSNTLILLYERIHSIRGLLCFVRIAVSTLSSSLGLVVVFCICAAECLQFPHIVQQVSTMQVRDVCLGLGNN